MFRQLKLVIAHNILEAEFKDYCNSRKCSDCIFEEKQGPHKCSYALVLAHIEQEIEKTNN